MKNLGRQFLSGVAFAAVSCAYAGTDYPFRAAEMTDVTVRSADLVDRTFGLGPTQLKEPSGHEEIELALCSLYRVTGEKRYLNLAKTFLDLRGRA